MGYYLTAKPNASVTLENGLPVGRDGSQLWFVENYGNFCVIYSLGIYDRVTHGEKEMVFSTNLSGNMVQLYNETGDYNKWIITRGNLGECYISHYEVVNKGLQANGASSIPILSSVKQNTQDTEEIRWNLIPIEASSFNNYYGGSIEKLSGGRLYVKVEVDSSTYENEIYTASDVSSACSQWRGISARVVIYGPGDSVPSGVSPYVVRIKGFEKQLDAKNKNAVAQFLAKSGDSYVNIWQNYDNGEIQLDVRSEGRMGNADADLRIHVLAHELGHALKMAHPHTSEHLANVANGRGAYAIEGNVASIMNQGGIYDTEKNAAFSPTTHDIINFKNKWGY